MTQVAFVVAVSRNGVIGRDGGLPWHISSDLKRFKELTMAKPVVMGRKTWESLPRRPLPGRQNIVLTRAPGFVAEGATVVATAVAALAAAGDVPEIAVIGGGEIYRLFWDKVEVVYLTEVDATVDGDTYFPPLAAGDWVEIAREEHPAGPRDSSGFTLRTMVRRKTP